MDIRKGRRADYRYETYETPEYSETRVVECIPHENQVLFYVTGSLDKQNRVCGKCYFLATNARDAREQYEYLYGWDADEVRMVRDEREINQVLHDKYKMP